MMMLERRPAPLAAMRLGAPLLACCFTLLVSAALLQLWGQDPLATLVIYFIEPLGTLYGVSEWLLRAVPLLLIGLGFAVALRANVWNVGADGMFTAGAITAAIPALAFGSQQAVWLIPLMGMAGIAGGMAWAAIPAFLKTRLGVNEILVTLMLNYVAALLLSALVTGPLRDPAGFNFPQSAPFDASAMLTPVAPGLRLNRSVLIALAAVPLTGLLLDRTLLGYRLTVAGAAPAAARYAGLDSARPIWVGFMISGGMAGLAGMLEVAGPLGQLSQVIDPGYGFTGIIAAFIGRLRPLGILLGALLLSLLALGGESAQMMTGLPTSVTRIFQGALLFFLLGADRLIDFRLRWRRA